MILFVSNVVFVAVWFECIRHCEDKMQSISKTILEESVKKIKCPVCGVETEPYYMKFHMCEKA